MEQYGQYFMYLGILITWSAFIIHWKKKKHDSPNTNIAVFALGTVFMWTSFLILVKGFYDHNYDMIVVHSFSDDSMTDIERIMAAWANRQGVMILWSALMNTIALSVLLVLRKDLNDEIIFRSITILLFITSLIATFAASPRNPTAFQTATPNEPAIGLTPSLLSFWQEIHPPIAFMAYSAFIFPYAAGLAILTLKQDEKLVLSPKISWLIDFYMMLGWGLTSIFIIAGSLWGYEENWSGFWAWDPVEIASVVMWSASTIYFHAKSHVARDHPLIAFSATLGWVGVTFAAFIVRSGLLEGLHVYVQSTENLVMSVVFGLMLLGTVASLFYAMSKNKRKVIPDEIFDWNRYKNKASVLTFWALVLLTVVNTVGLTVQLVNAVLFDQTNIPYAYYIVTNGILLISLAILFVLCEFKPSDWSTQSKYRIYGISAVISIVSLYFIIGHNPFVYVLQILLFTIFISMVINMIKTTLVNRNFKRFSMQLVHLAILMMIISYTSVDQSSIIVEETLIPGNITEIEEFDFSLMATRYFEGEFSHVRIDILNNNNKIGEVILTQGLHGSLGSTEYWQRGDWEIKLTKDYFFRFQDDTEGQGEGPRTRPVFIEIQEKPLANMFRITFGMLIIVTTVGLYSKIKRRNKAYAD